MPLPQSQWQTDGRIGTAAAPSAASLKLKQQSSNLNCFVSPFL